MNALQLLAALFVMSLGILGAVLAARTWEMGALGGIFGMVVGVAALKLLNLSANWRPNLPTCAKGKCRSGNYRWAGDVVDGTFFGSPAFRGEPPLARGTGALFRCQCGDLYLLSPLRFLGSRRFAVVGDDGRAVPYMWYRPFGQWLPDKNGAVRSE